MKQLIVGFKTLSIKARIANILRKELYFITNDDYTLKYGKNKKKLTDKEKIEYFDKLLPLVQDMHRELNNYKSKRKEKAEIQRLREERLKEKVNT